MAWGPWITPGPSPVSYTHVWNEFGFAGDIERNPTTGDTGYHAAVLNSALANLQGGSAGTPSDAWPGTGNSNLLLIAPIEWGVSITLEGPFPDDHLEYQGIDAQLLVSFAVTSMPTLNTYPTASDSAVPGDPGTVGDIQYEGGTDSFYWTDFSQNWYTLGAGSLASQRLGIRFASYVDPAAGFAWPAYSSTDQAGDILGNTTVNVRMADFPAYYSASSFSLWYTNGVEAATDADLAFSGFVGGGGAGDSGGWQTDALATWPTPVVQTPRYRRWLGDAPNIAGDRGPDRVNFIPIHRRRP